MKIINRPTKKLKRNPQSQEKKGLWKVFKSDNMQNCKLEIQLKLSKIAQTSERKV